MLYFLMKKLNNNKVILICVAVFCILFLIYHLELSPYAQCVEGYKNRYGSGEIGTADAKVYCGSKSR